MKKITAPLKYGDKGDAVADLQDALLVLIKYAHIKLDPTAQATLMEIFSKDCDERLYDEATARLVFTFRADNNLGDLYSVDDPTAALMNALLDEKLDGAYTVSGRVLDVKGIAVASVVVRANDQDRYRKDLLGEAVTDSEGKYSITFSESQFRKTKDEVSGPDVIVRAFSQEDLLLAVSKRKTMEGMEFTNFDLTIHNEQFFTVKCVIQDSNGNPAKGLYVQVFDQDLRNRQLLGTDRTDANGIARTDFLRADFQLGDFPLKRGPHLIVEARMKLNGDLLATQEMEMRDQIQVFRFVLPAPSEWERLCSAISPLLKGQGRNGTDLPITELNEKDIDFLASETGQPMEHIAILLAAIKTALTSSIFPEADLTLENQFDSTTKLEILSSVFYGWFREGQPQQFKELIARPMDTLLGSLSSAIEHKIIPVLDEKLKKVIFQAIQTYR